MKLEDIGNGRLNEEQAKRFVDYVTEQGKLFVNWTCICLECGYERSAASRDWLHFCWLRRLWNRLRGKKPGIIDYTKWVGGVLKPECPKCGCQETKQLKTGPGQYAEVCALCGQYRGRLHFRSYENVREEENETTEDR